MNNSIFIRFLILLSISHFYLGISAQNKSGITEYLKEAGEYAIIYNGEIEPLYSFVYYNNFPYYQSPEYRTGNVLFRGIDYPNQQLRLDLYKDQLIILTPVTNIGKILNPQNIESFTMGNKKFIRHISTSQKDIKSGYYLLLFSGKYLKLLCKELYSLESNPGKNKQTFRHKKFYYLLYKGEYYSINSKRAIKKLFPEYNKLIDKYAKENSLDFEANQEECLAKLVEFCESQIIINTGEQ